jgi:hypothetical protein
MPLNKLPRHPLLLAFVVVLGAAAAGFSIAKIRSLTASGSLTTAPVWNFNQGSLTQQDGLTQGDDQDSEANEVSPAQVEQYLKVYKAMQLDRKLTVEQATAAQHMTVEQFRDIEARIERDGVLRERVRRELLKTAQEKSNALKPKLQSAPSPSQP